jgi:hypothetical protein
VAEVVVVEDRDAEKNGEGVAVVTEDNGEGRHAGSLSKADLDCECGCGHAGRRSAMDYAIGRQAEELCGGGSDSETLWGWLLMNA